MHEYLRDHGRWRRTARATNPIDTSSSLRSSRVAASRCTRRGRAGRSARCFTFFTPVKHFPAPPMLSETEQGLFVGILIGEGSFGGDGKQPQGHAAQAHSSRVVDPLARRAVRGPGCTGPITTASARTTNGSRAARRSSRTCCPYSTRSSGPSSTPPRGAARPTCSSGTAAYIARVRARAAAHERRIGGSRELGRALALPADAPPHSGGCSSAGRRCHRAEHGPRPRRGRRRPCRRRPRGTGARGPCATRARSPTWARGGVPRARARGRPAGRADRPGRGERAQVRVPRPRRRRRGARATSRSSRSGRRAGRRGGGTARPRDRSRPRSAAR